MSIASNAWNYFDCDSTGRAFRRTVFFFAVLGLVAACQPEGGPPALSLEEAKKATATFEGQSFTPPPKSIVDIEKLLESQPPADPKAAEKDRAHVASKPPAGASEEEIALFYYHRAEAADRIGLIAQALDDLRKAYPLSHAVSERNARRHIGQELSRMEIESGDIMAGMRIRHDLAEAYPLPENRLSDFGVLAMDYANGGNLERAEHYLSRAEAEFRELQSRRSWARSSEIFTRNISSFRAEVLRAKGELATAEESEQTAADLTRRIRDSRDHFRWDRQYGSHLNRLASLLKQRGKLLEAEVVARDAIKDSLRTQGRYSRRTASHLLALSSILGTQGRNEDSERIVRYVLDAFGKMGLDSTALQMLRPRLVLALALAGQSRWEDSAAEFEAVEQALAGQPPFVKRSIGSSPVYPFALARTGRYDRARRVAESLLETKLEAAGENSIETARLRGALAMALAGLGRDEQALAVFAKAIPILLQRSRRSDSEDGNQTVNDVMVRLTLESYIDLLSKIRGTGLEAKAGVDGPPLTFQLAQIASARAVQRALGASAARAAARDAGLADLVRREQDAVARIGALNGLLSNVLNLSAENRDEKALTDLRTRIDTLRGARAALAEEIEKRFPDYAALMNPKPAMVADVQRTLRPGEALIATYVAEKATYVWAVPKSGRVAFASAPLGRDRVAAAVAQLRRALDPQAATLGDIPAFDAAGSHRLYRALLGRVEAGWKGAKSLLVVAHGPLGQLPFNVLVTEDVKSGADKAPLFSNYRAVPFLARSHAVTVLPSVSALATLRALPAASPTRRAFAGFGDPVFAATQVAASGPATGSGAVATRGLLQVRGLPVRLRSAPKLDDAASADLAKLPRLPDTADEVRGIAVAMNADLTRDVFTGKAASEGRVKSMRLSGYKVLAFATHGLVPGDLDGLTQPALALSSPKVAGGTDDGLLTMGEILGLKLDADWVVLSACNTASGDGAGAEAVSGLGRAFFYAGTRALLVSNWPVETTSARALTTDIFKRQAEAAGLGRAEALRQSMLALIDGPGFRDEQGRTVFSYAHPIFWAPFSLVGDGGGGTPAG